MAPFDYFAIYQFINSTIVCAPHVRHSLWQSQLVAHAKYVSIEMPFDLPPATWMRFMCTTLHQVNDISVRHLSPLHPVSLTPLIGCL